MTSKQANLSTAFEENIMNWLKKNKFSGFAKSPALKGGLQGAGIGGAVGLLDADRKNSQGDFEGKSSREKMLEYLKNIGMYGAIGGAVKGGLGARKGIKMRDALVEKQMERLRPAIAKQIEKVEAAGLSGAAREEALQKIKKDLETSVPHTAFTEDSARVVQKAAPKNTSRAEKSAPVTSREIPENTRKAKKFNLADTVYETTEEAKKMKAQLDPYIQKGKTTLDKAIESVKGRMKPEAKAAPSMNAAREFNLPEGSVAPNRRKNRLDTLLTSLADKKDSAIEDIKKRFGAKTQNTRKRQRINIFENLSTKAEEAAEKAKNQFSAAASKASPVVEDLKNRLSAASTETKNRIKSKIDELYAQGAANRTMAESKPSISEALGEKIKQVNETVKDFRGFDDIPSFARQTEETLKEAPKVVQSKAPQTLEDFVPAAGKAKIVKNTEGFKRMGGDVEKAAPAVPELLPHQRQRAAIQKEYEHHMDLLAKDNYNSEHIRNAQNAKRKLEALDKVDRILGSGNASSKDLEEAAKRVSGVRFSDAGVKAPEVTQETKKPFSESFMSSVKREQPSAPAQTEQAATSVAAPMTQEEAIQEEIGLQRREGERAWNRKNRKKFTNSDAAAAKARAETKTTAQPAAPMSNLDELSKVLGAE